MNVRHLGHLAVVCQWHLYKITIHMRTSNKLLYTVAVCQTLLDEYYDLSVELRFLR